MKTTYSKYRHIYYSWRGGQIWQCVQAIRNPSNCKNSDIRAAINFTYFNIMVLLMLIKRCLSTFLSKENEAIKIYHGDVYLVVNIWSGNLTSILDCFFVDVIHLNFVYYCVSHCLRSRTFYWLNNFACWLNNFTCCLNYFTCWLDILSIICFWNSSSFNWENQNIVFKIAVVLR